jgi:hypothetical protein
MLMCSVHDDEEVAREITAQIAFHTAPKAYTPMFAKSRKAFADRDTEANDRDRILDPIGVAGTAEQPRRDRASRVTSTTSCCAPGASP